MKYAQEFLHSLAKDFSSYLINPILKLQLVRDIKTSQPGDPLDTRSHSGWLTNWMSVWWCGSVLHSATIAVLESICP